MGDIGLDYSPIISNCSLDVLEVRTLVLSNVGQADATVDLEFVRDGSSYRILKSCRIPAGESLLPFMSRDFFVNLEPGDFLEARSSGSPCQFACSYDGLAGLCPSSSSSSVASSSSSMDGLGCCYPSDGNFYPATNEFCLANNPDGRNMWHEDECAAPGTTEQLIMSNLGEFRNHSLDMSLMDLYFNQGVNSTVVDLDEQQASSSSSPSAPFLLRLSLYRRARNPFDEDFVLPEDIQLYIYAESVDGNFAWLNAQATKVPGENEVIVSLGEFSRPDGSSEFSFQLNIEHQDFATSRTTFIFRKDQEYSHSIPLYGRVPNVPGRLTQEYMLYLQSWMFNFWNAYDSGDPTLISPLTNPESNANTEFYPFAHAAWQIEQQYAQQSLASGSLDSQTQSAPPNTSLVEPWNFLGVSPGVWNCIKRNGLYKSFDDPPQGPAGHIINSGAGASNLSFNCRSFAIAGSRFLEQQLQEDCPGAKTEVQVVGWTIGPHAIVKVILPGAPSPCCVGTFFVEPYTGDAFDTMDEYCKSVREGCAPNPDLGSYPVGGIPANVPGKFNWPDDDWEKDAGQLNRIQDVICGCLGGNYPSGTMEAILKEKCQNNTFQDWFVLNFAHERGEPEPTLNMPQIISCDRVECFQPDDPASNGKKCLDSPNGIEPYVCETRCLSKWDCAFSGKCEEIYSLNAALGEYETKELCDSFCGTSGAWCEVDAGTKFNSGCAEGSKHQWLVADEDTKQSFKEGKNCFDLESECALEAVCIQQWSVKYNCKKESWERMFGGKSTYACVKQDSFNFGSWVPALGNAGECYYDFNVLGAPCSGNGNCSHLSGVPYDDESALDGVKTLPDFIPPGCCQNACCIEGSCDSTKDTRASCETAGGTWLPGVSCDEAPCQGGCCCRDGNTDTFIANQAECEDCTPPPAYCNEWLSLEDPEQPCPSGWTGSGGGCYKSSMVSDCTQCTSSVEGSFPDCWPGAMPSCGTWYPECAVARKYVAYINYTSGYFYECGGAIYFGPNGTCPFFWPPFPSCMDDLSSSVGHFDTYDECQAFYDNVIETRPEGIYGCDWPPAVGSGCQQICIDGNSGP